MIGATLKIAAIGSVGYTLGKLILDEEFRGDIKDKISDLVCPDYEEVELEESTDLDESTFIQNDTKQITYEKR